MFNIVGGPQPGQMQMGTTPRSLNAIPTTPANPAGGETAASRGSGGFGPDMVLRSTLPPGTPGGGGPSGAETAMNSMSGGSGGWANLGSGESKTPSQPERPEPPGGRERPQMSSTPDAPTKPLMQLGGTPGANPTASFRRFNQDEGAGSMGHHWGEAE
jgi:hypothetical protein